MKKLIICCTLICAVENSIHTGGSNSVVTVAKQRAATYQLEKFSFCCCPTPTRSLADALYIVFKDESNRIIRRCTVHHKRNGELDILFPGDQLSFTPYALGTFSRSTPLDTLESQLRGLENFPLDLSAITYQEAPEDITCCTVN